MIFGAVKDLTFACGTPVAGHAGPVWVHGKEDLPRNWEMVTSNGCAGLLRVEDKDVVDGWCTHGFVQCYADHNRYLRDQLDTQYSKLNEWWDKVYEHPDTPCRACRATWDIADDGKWHVTLENLNDELVVDVRLKIAVAETEELAELICDVINNAMEEYETSGANGLANSLLKSAMERARTPAGKEVPHEVSTPPA